MLRTDLVFRHVWGVLDGHIDWVLVDKVPSEAVVWPNLHVQFRRAVGEQGLAAELRPLLRVYVNYFHHR